MDLELARHRWFSLPGRLGSAKAWYWEEQAGLVPERGSFKNVGKIWAEGQSPWWRASRASCWVGFGHPISKRGTSKVSE